MLARGVLLLLCAVLGAVDDAAAFTAHVAKLRADLRGNGPWDRARPARPGQWMGFSASERASGARSQA